MFNKKVTIGIPCYNEELNVETTFNALKKITKKIHHYHFDFIFIDNGSVDKTREKINKIASKDKQVTGIFLSRNFGPEASGQAIVDYTFGDALIIIPCDLQDPPELIPKFIKRWSEGYSIVLGAYAKSKDNSLMTFIRKAFYKIFKSISNIEVPINVTGFGLIDKKTLNVMRSLPERYRFGRGLLMWIGFKKTYITYERRKRLKGKSSYNIFEYIKQAERGIFGFSYLVLDLMVYAGFLLVILSFIFIVVYLFTVIVFGNPIKAQIPIMLSIVFFGGVQLLAISIIGKYIQVIVEETKARPTYIVDEIINGKTK